MLWKWPIIISRMSSCCPALWSTVLTLSNRMVPLLELRPPSSFPSKCSVSEFKVVTFASSEGFYLLRYSLKKSKFVHDVIHRLNSTHFLLWLSACYVDIWPPISLHVSHNFIFEVTALCFCSMMVKLVGRWLLAFSQWWAPRWSLSWNNVSNFAKLVGSSSFRRHMSGFKVPPPPAFFLRRSIVSPVPMCLSAVSHIHALNLSRTGVGGDLIRGISFGFSSKPYFVSTTLSIADQSSLYWTGDHYLRSCSI